MAPIGVGSRHNPRSTLDDGGRGKRMRRTANDRPVVTLLGSLWGLTLALGLLLGAGGAGPARSQALVQGQDVALAPGAFALASGPAVTSTRIVLDVPSGQTGSVYSATVHAPLDFTDLALRW